MAKCPQCSKTHSSRLSKFCSKPCSDLYVLNYNAPVTLQGKMDADLRESRLQNVIEKSEEARQAAVRKTKLKEERDKWYTDTISKCEWRKQRDKDKIKLIKYQQNDKCFKCKKQRMMNPVHLDGNRNNKDRTNIVCVCSYCKSDMKSEIHFNMKAARIAMRAAKKAESSK
jgi:hypothetical protein